MKHLIRAALFDLDGVIVFTDKYHYLAWKRLADEEGWAFDEQLNHQLRGIPRLASLQVMLDHNKVTLSEEEKSALADRKNGYYCELLQTMDAPDLYPGAVGFLEQLKARGVQLGLCSSSKNARTVLDRLGLTRLFDVIVTGHDFARAKPDPEVFQLAADRLGVPAFHCIVFEDAAAGVQAARAARMKCIGVGPPEVLPDAPETIQRYDEIDLDVMLYSGRPARPPVEPWSLTEMRVNPRRAQYWETLFALTNGYMGLRGTYEEDDGELAEHAYPGMFLNGIYDYEPYHHVVSFPGYPERRHVMLNMCDWRIIHLYVGGERFSMFTGRVSEYRRELDMRRGVVTRSLVWESPGGRRVRIRTTRVVSMARRHSAAIRYEVTPLGFAGPLIFESVVHAKSRSGEMKGDHLEIVEHGTPGDARYYVSRTKTAPFRVGMAFTHRLAGSGGRIEHDFEPASAGFTERFAFDAEDGQTVTFDKHACFHTNVDTEESRVRAEAVAGVEKDRAEGFDQLLAEHTAFWERYWDIADIEIDGSVGDQQAVRLAMFHLRQSNPEDDRRSISACGMTGDHYWGHVFWDTEMYITPHFLYTQPETVRPLLMYRYHLLDRARERARQMGGVGALYAWNSISGEECGVVFEASTAEYHLVSDVAYGVAQYVRATGDEEFLYACGAEMLFETARFLADRGRYIPTKHDQFCINVVCGPDEYGCGVNNNCFTNAMAQWHFRFAADVHAQMQRVCPDHLAALAERIGLQPDEPGAWRRAADRMYIPFNEALGIHEQDDSFLHLDPVDMSRLPLHTDLRNEHHPLNLWRMQVVKQADVVLLMFILGEQFTRQQKRANYEYYEPRTNHGSSLSTSIHSVLASEIGRGEDALGYFRHSAYMDINDFKDNTAGGVHAACLGGTWMAVVHGFAGMRDYESGLRFDPVLPGAWNAYRFKLVYQGRVIEVHVTRDGVAYRLVSGDKLTFHSCETELTLTPALPTAKAGVRRFETND